MKFVTCLTLFLFFVVSTPFVATATSSGEPVSSQVVTKTKRTTRHLSHRTKVTTKKVSHKTWRGTKRVVHKTRIKSKPIRKKTWRGGRKVVSRTKKIIS